ncbi:triple tyrosine motif-containing protein [Flavobacterium sp. RNTU_13]|uniref:helix-turn-helix and ligand-binding sensor domain-containing protein n=1 Tax=Flavobacterium sp. RNTU_13 TaxID=3375145 RepID=UPI003987D40F
MNSRFTFFLLLTLFATTFCNGQVKNIGLPKIINYKKSDYLGGAQNWEMGQDSRGNMYFANTEGMLQYNGTSWTKYPIPNATVRSLKVDKSGRIYVGGYNEFGYFEANAKGKLVYHSISKLATPNSKKIIDFVWKVHILGDEVIFQTFFRTYIYKSGKITVLEAPNRFQFSFVLNNTLYFQDIAAGLLEYRNGTLTSLPNTEVFNNTEVWGILPYTGNRLLVITIDKGIYLYDFRQVTPWKCEASSFVAKNSSLGGRILNERFIELNTVLNGIIICDMSGNIIQHINNKKGLLNNTALSSCLDSSGNLWLGLDNGIAYLNINSPFTYLGTSFDLSSVYASAVYQSNLYVATNQGVFSHSWKQPFKEDNFTFLPGTTGQAWGLEVVDNEMLCLHNRGLFTLVNGKPGRWLDDRRGYLGLKKIPGKPNYLMASNYHGFAILEKTPQGWQYRNQIDGFNVSDSRFVTDGQNVWLLKNFTLYRLKLSNDMKRFTVTATYEGLSKSVKNITSTQMINGKIYVQGQNRFFLYDASNDRFVEDKNMSGIFSKLPKLRYCFEDNKGNICYFYAESSMGMLMKQPNGTYKDVRSPFSAVTGNLVYFFESVNTIDERNIFIGLTEGLAHYNPKLYYGNADKPKVFIKSFSFDNDTLYTGNKPNIQPAAVPYKYNSVKFNFSSPAYDNPENIKFSYKLDGFDDKWSNWSNVPVKEYTNLSEGSYRMAVKAINSSGEQSDPVMVSFSINPPIYRHPVAYVFYILLIGTGIYLGRRRVKLKMRQSRYYETLEQRRLYLERETKIRQEQYELEKEIERLKNEQLKVKILTKDKELVNNSLQVVKKNKMLNGIINKLKDINPEQMDEATRLQFNKLNKTISKELNTDKSWNNLEKHIRNVHFDFLKRLKEKYPAITPREMDLATYLLMNMSTKEIAEIMNISDGGVELARYRLRKKLDLPRKENLTGFLMTI